MAKVLDSRIPLLFQGEAGTGKESLARVLHGSGTQRHGPFVVIQCQAASEEQLEDDLFGTRNGKMKTEGNWGKIGAADGGTVFLKNVDALPPALQLRILRLQQDKAVRQPESRETRKIDLRLIASTTKHLEREVNAGKFRQDLYFRLTVYQCDLLPLRERKPDIPKFVSFFAVKFAKEINDEPLVFTERALSQLEAHEWPGNIGELKQAVLCSLLEVDKNNKTVDQIKWTNNNVTNISSSTLSHDLKQYEIKSVMNNVKKEALEQTTFP